jgi:replicative DNA helicase
MNALPVSQTAEECAISILSELPDAWLKLRWDASMFHLPLSALVFRTMADMRERGEDVHKLSIIGRMQADGLESEKVAHSVLAMNQSVPVCMDAAKTYWHQLAELKQRRGAITIALSGAEGVASGEITPDMLAAMLTSTLAESAQIERKSIKDHVKDAIRAMESREPVEQFCCDIRELDAALCLKRGELAVVGGGTGSGKSVLLLQAALYAANHGKRVFVASLEMPPKTVIFRMISNSLGFTVNQRATYNKGQTDRICPELARVSKLAIEISQSNDIDDIIREAMAFRADMIILDYIQLATLRTKADTREQVVSEIARKLKLTAMNQNMAVFTASQLNDDGKLRESRAIGQHADYVIGIGIDGDGFFLQKVRDGESNINITSKLNGATSRWR